jgi:hypothetical protein
MAVRKTLSAACAGILSPEPRRINMQAGRPHVELTGDPPGGRFAKLPLITNRAPTRFRSARPVTSRYRDGQA